MGNLDVINIPHVLGRKSMQVVAHSTPMFVVNKESHVAQTDPDDPYGIAKVAVANDGNVLLVQVPDGASYLDLFHHFVITSGDFLDLPTTTTLKVRSFGWRSLEVAGARPSQPFDFDATNFKEFGDSNLQLPLAQRPGAPVPLRTGMWFPLFDKNGVHELEFDGTPEIIRHVGGEGIESSSSSWSSAAEVQFALDSDDHFVSVSGAQYVMAVVSQAAANTGTDLLGMVLGSFVW